MVNCSKFLHCIQVIGSIVLIVTFIFFFILLWYADCLLRQDSFNDAGSFGMSVVDKNDFNCMCYLDRISNSQIKSVLKRNIANA